MTRAVMPIHEPPARNTPGYVSSARATQPARPPARERVPRIHRGQSAPSAHLARDERSRAGLSARDLVECHVDKTYKPRTGMKVGCWVLAVLCAVFIVGLPGTFIMLWIAHGAYVRITDEKLYVRWIGTREIPWKDISGLSWG